MYQLLVYINSFVGLYLFVNCKIYEDRISQADVSADYYFYTQNILELNPYNDTAVLDAEIIMSQLTDIHPKYIQTIANNTGTKSKN